jgi:hypothetical protein
MTNRYTRGANQGVPRPRSRPHCQAESQPRSAARRPNSADLQNRVDQLKEQGEKGGGALRLQRRRRDPLRGAELAVTRGRAAK